MSYCIFISDISVGPKTQHHSVLNYSCKKTEHGFIEFQFQLEFTVGRGDISSLSCGAATWICSS